MNKGNSIGANSMPILPSSISKCRILYNLKLRGGALFVAIMISIIIGVVLSMFILIARFNQQNVTVFSQSAQLHFNLQSALEIAQSAYFSTEKNGAWFKNTFNDDSTRIKKIGWGGYFVISVETKNRHETISQSGIFGTLMFPDTGLIVSETSRPVNLSGNIILKANCYLPSAGIKPSNIEGLNYVSAPQNLSFIKKTSIQSPRCSEVFIANLIEQQNNYDRGSDSIVISLDQAVDRSFTKNTIVWQVSSILLRDLKLKNNIKIVGDVIEVSSSAELSNILIVCNKIKFATGFTGKIHVIARDSILMGENCTFQYPSSFILLPGISDPSDLKTIEFAKACKLYGGVLAFGGASLDTKTNPVFVKLTTTSEISGFIYSSNYLQVQGAIYASAICDKLLIKTQSGVYENQILSCEINPRKYSQLLAIPSIFDGAAQLKCCEQIN